MYLFLLKAHEFLMLSITTLIADISVYFPGSNVITWKNMTSGRVISAGMVNVINDPRINISRDGRQLTIENVTEHDAGRYRQENHVCTYI